MPATNDRGRYEVQTDDGDGWEGVAWFVAYNDARQFCDTPAMKHRPARVRMPYTGDVTTRNALTGDWSKVEPDRPGSNKGER